MEIKLLNLSAENNRFNVRSLISLCLILVVILLQALLCSITYSKCVTLMVYSLVLFEVFKRYKNIYHPNVLFLISFLVFLLSRIILSFITGESFGKTEFFTNYIFSKDIQFNILFSLQTALIGFYLGVFQVRYEKPKLIAIILKKKKDVAFELLTLIIFHAALIAKLFVIFSFIFQIYSSGYLSLYTSPPKIPFLVNIFSSMFFLASASLFVFLADYKFIVRYKIIYLLILILSLFTGSRGTFVIDLLTYMYFSTRRNLIKINILKVIGIASIFILILQIAGAIRFGNGISNFENLFVTFLWDQGGSIDIQGYTIENLNKLPNGFFIMMKPLLDPYLTLLGLNNIVDLENPSTAMSSYSLGHILSYLIDQDKFQIGFGLGSSYISELYIAGGFISVLFGSFIYSRFFSYLTKKSLENRIASFILFIIMPFYIFSPRWSYLGFISNLNYVVKYMIFFIVMYFFIKGLMSIKFKLHEEKNIICYK